MLDEKEKLNLDAIARIHRHLDDDKNGNVDLKESIGVYKCYIGCYQIPLTLNLTIS